MLLRPGARSVHPYRLTFRTKAAVVGAGVDVSTCSPAWSARATLASRPPRRRSADSDWFFKVELREIVCVVTYQVPLTALTIT
jgi:hypothetical protein